MSPDNPASSSAMSQKRKRQDNDEISMLARDALEDSNGSDLIPQRESPLEYGRRFRAAIVTLRVGHVDFLVHEPVLELSPVLTQMFCGPFMESNTKIAKLSDDNPETFGLLLDYMYAYLGRTGPDLLMLFYGSWRSQAKILERAADLIILADKYGVPGIETIVLRWLKYAQFNPDLAAQFFRTAELLYDHNLVKDRDLKKYFRTNVTEALEVLDDSPAHSEDIMYAQKLLERGDDLSADLGRASAGFWIRTGRLGPDTERTRAQLEEELRTTCLRLDEVQANLERERSDKKDIEYDHARLKAKLRELQGFK